MGVLYTVLPLSEDVSAWLDEIGVPYAYGPVPSRNPTVRELRDALSSMPEVRVQFDEPVVGRAWGALLDVVSSAEAGLWTQLNVLSYQGDDQPHEFHFEKGWPQLILRALKCISAVTGPLVLIPDTGSDPLVVSADLDVEYSLSTWEHTRVP